MSHTPERWLQGAECSTLIHRQSGEVIATTKTVEDARLIVARVNACAGIPTEDIERWSVLFKPLWDHVHQLVKEKESLQAALHTQAEESAKLIEQRDELLAALKLTSAVCAGHSMTKSGLVNALEAARAAIEKATN